MSEHHIESDRFCLRFSLHIEEADTSFPINTLLTVYVKSNDFSAKADIDIDIKAFADFAIQLKTVYDTLSGEASIREPYGCQRYIKFEADKSGYISVSGLLCDDHEANELRFYNSFDQTHLKLFAEGLVREYSKYKKK